MEFLKDQQGPRMMVIGNIDKKVTKKYEYRRQRRGRKKSFRGLKKVKVL